MNVKLLRVIITTELEKFEDDPKLELLGVRIYEKVLDTLVSDGKRFSKKINKKVKQKRDAKFSFVCKICNNESLGSSVNTTVCKNLECQKQQKRIYARNYYEKMMYKKT